MNPLLVAPTEAQARLLALIWDSYASTDAWPIFHYVAGRLYRDSPPLDAGNVLLSCPGLRYPAGPGSYGWVWLAGGNARFPKDDDQIGLTVVGMSRLSSARREVELFLTALAGLVGAERDVELSPSTVRTVDVSSAQLRTLLFPPTSGVVLQRLGQILRHEPSTWGFLHQVGDTEPWTATPNSTIRAYVGVRSADDYADRLANVISPPRPEPPPVLVSYLALPEAIDYLNAVWRVRTKEPLFLIRRAEAAAKLAFECATVDEFESRVSALCGILDHPKIPGVDAGSKLGDLAKYLADQLPADTMPRVTNAIDDLRSLFGLRAWRQHHGADERGLSAMLRLGVALPTDDWGSAWQTVHARMVAVISAIREEIEADAFN